jgi:hypothetical protein
VYRADTPEEAANYRVFKGSEATKVLSFLKNLLLSQLKNCGDSFLKRWCASTVVACPAGAVHPLPMRYPDW